MRKIFCTLRISIALLVFSAPGYPSSLPHSPLGHSLRIMTYNVWSLPGPISPRKERLYEIRTWLERFQPADVISIQEAFTPEARRVFSNVKGYPYVIHGVGPFPESSRPVGDGLMMISRYPIRDQDRAELPQCTGTDCLAQKGILFATIELPNGRLMEVANTHFNAGGNEESRQVRITQSYFLKNFLEFRPRDRLQVVAGDFNLDRFGQDYERMRNLLQMEDLFTLALTRSNGLSFPKSPEDGQTFNPRVNWWARASGPISSAPDHIWARLRDAFDWSFSLTGVSVDRPLSEKANGPKDLSDHFPLSAEIRITP